MILSRRKFESGVTTYKLNFNASNNDYVTFGSGTSWITFNNCVVEVTFSNLTTTTSTVMGLFGQHRASGVADRWFIAWRGSDNTFFCRLGTSTLDFTSTAESGTIRLEGDGTSTRSYLDGVLQTTSSTNSTSASSSYLLNIACQNDSAGTSVDTSGSLEGTIHSAMIDDGTTVTEFEINEGSGSTTTSDQSDVGTINTDDAGGVTYINSTMWEAE